MNDVALFEARNRLSESIDRVEAGEEITTIPSERRVADRVTGLRLGIDRESVDIGQVDESAERSTLTA